MYSIAFIDAHAVARLVDARREADDRHLARHDGDDAAAHAGLGWQSGGISPHARLVVEAGHHHDRQHLGNVARVDHALLRDRD